MAYTFLTVAILTAVLSISADAYVIPQRGGGTISGTIAPMIMPEITFDGTNIVVLDAVGNDWVTLTGSNRPLMRTLTGTDALDPAAMWYSSLNGKAWNWQYGWANGSLNQSLIPTGDKIWIELLSQSDGLKIYDRNNNYAPIFGTDGSSNIWKWNEAMSMSHNAYTVAPSVADWSATYKVYIGDAVTGAPIAGFGSDTATLTWTSTPEPATLGIMGMGLVYLVRQKRNVK
jgi:hypothetical protein